MPLKLKMNGEYAVLQDGKPVYVADDGTESAIDVAGTVATITRLNGEAKASRIRAETAETGLKAFEGISDPAAALKAMELTANYDAKKLIDAGEAQRVRDDITKTYSEKIAASDKRFSDLQQSFHNSEVGGAFARSKYIAEKIAVPADMLRAVFGSQFKVEDGKLSVHDAQGQRMVSKVNPGEYAGFDEGLAMLVDGYAYKDSILKGNSNGGSGTRQSNGTAGPKEITRAAFDAMSQGQRAQAFRDGNSVID